MSRMPGYLVAKYVNDILNNIDDLKDSVAKCDPKAIVHSSQIIKISKEALNKGIIEKVNYDKWISATDELDKRFIEKCSCLGKAP